MKRCLASGLRWYHASHQSSTRPGQAVKQAICMQCAYMQHWRLMSSLVARACILQRHARFARQCWDSER